MSSRTIQPADLIASLSMGDQPELLDVRTPREYEEVHAAGAKLVPLDQLDVASVMRDRADAGKPLYVLCASGSRARKACDQFARAGYDNVVCVEGGTKAWEQANGPVVRGRKTISIERQTRIAIGSCVLIGLALGVFVSPWFLLISTMMGAGLVFAGVTDFCGLAVLIAKMPWNRASCGVSNASAHKTPEPETQPTAA